MAVKNNTYNIQEIGLAKALVRKGNVCDVVFWTDKQEETVTIPVDNCGEVCVFYRHGKTKFKNTIFDKCEDLFAKYDILQPCEYNQMQAWLLAKNQPNKTVIYHGPYYSPFNKRYNLMCKVFDVIFLKRYIKQKTKFLVKSELAKEFLIKKGISPSNICVVGVGIDAQMLSSGRCECQEKLYLQIKRDSDKLKMLYIGRFEERRNVFFIIEVFAKVFQQNKNARLYMVGTGEVEYIKAVFKYADELGCRKYIYWQERIEQKYLSDIYKQVDFFLLPTKYEIFGMVLLEAMYYKTIVVTTQNGGSSMLIKDGENGKVLESNDTNLWSNFLMKVYSNKNLMIKMKDNASETITKYFMWDCIANAFIKQYKRMISEL